MSIYLPGDSDALGRYRLKLDILRWTIRGWKEKGNASNWPSQPKKFSISHKMSPP